jgi:iron uptake system EfeUOB component EfeO/EfeM
MTVEKLIERLQRNYKPTDVIAYDYMDKEMFESFANIKITDEQWRSIANDFNNTGSEDFYETLAWFFSELVENNA